MTEKKAAEKKTAHEQKKSRPVRRVTAAEAQVRGVRVGAFCLWVLTLPQGRR
jgi:hypothetical protein